MADVELLPCGECGMPCRAGEYHPFAACLMFKACHNSETVRANLAPLQAENERLRAEVERLRRLVQERDTMLGKRLCSGTNADGKPRCIVLAEERARAERLAEALRDAREFVAEALSDERAKFAGYEAASDIAGIEATLQKIDAALAQEDRND